jgi:hypothetical protein
MKKLLLLWVCCPSVIQATAQSLLQKQTTDNITINSNAGTRGNKTSSILAAADTSQPLAQKSIITHAATDITMLPASREVIVYPNPASERVTLAYSAEKSATTIISIYSMQGTLLRTYNSGKVIQGLFYQQLIDLSDLPAGRYMYKLTNGTKVVNGIIAKGG